MVVSSQPFEDTAELTGQVEAPEDARLAAESGGVLTYLAPLGTSVRRGARVASTDATLAQAGVAQARAAVQAAEAQVQAAQAQLDLAEDQYRRQEPLFRDSIISSLEFQGVQSQRASARAQVAAAQAQVAQAQAALRQAQTQASNARVTAPFSGTVEAHLAERGEFVAPGTPVVRLVSGGGVKVTAGVPERYAGDVEIGTPVRVTPNAAGAEPLSGRVTFVGRAVDAQSRTFPIEVSLPSGASALRPEMVVRLAVSRGVVGNALSVPLHAIERDERGPGVYVVSDRDDGLVVERRAVELGSSSSGRTVVTSGLSVGDRVITSGGVTEGDRVRIDKSTDDLAVSG